MEGGDRLEGEEWREIRERLRARGIKLLLEEPREEDGRWVVAEGRPPVPGRDGGVECLLLKEVSEGDEALCRNLREVGGLMCVRRGTRVLRKIPPEPGMPGVDVFGREVSPPPVKDAELRYGEGLVMEGPYLVVTTDGVLTEEGGVLSVREEYVLSGDVDYKVGNIRFRGKRLEVKGTICHGFTVEAEGELVIRRGIEDGARVRVKGRLESEGVVAAQNTVVEVEGDAILRQVEYAFLRVSGNCKVSDYLLQTRTEVGGELAVRGKGIVGGEITVKGSVFATAVGSPAHVPTVLEIAPVKDLLSQRREILERMEWVETNLERVRCALKKAGSLSQQELVKKTEDLQKRLEEEKTSLEEKLKQIQEEIEQRRQAYLEVSDRLYGNTKIYLADRILAIKEDLKGPLRVFLEEGEIRAACILSP